MFKAQRTLKEQNRSELIRAARSGLETKNACKVIDACIYLSINSKTQNKTKDNRYCSVWLAIFTPCKI